MFWLDGALGTNSNVLMICLMTPGWMKAPGTIYKDATKKHNPAPPKPVTSQTFSSFAVCLSSVVRLWPTDTIGSTVAFHKE
jgi:hypothetical protein